MDDDQTTKPSATVISLTHARLVRDARAGVECRHFQIVVDHHLEQVVCRDCGERLNAVDVLYRYATEESMLSRRIAECAQVTADLAKRIRCRCQHCGEFTRINV